MLTVECFLDECRHCAAISSGIDNTIVRLDSGQPTECLTAHQGELRHDLGEAGRLHAPAAPPWAKLSVRRTTSKIA